MMQKKYKKPNSFSQNVVFWTCPRTWYLHYILGIKKEEELVYAHRGSAVHHCLENYYPEKTMKIEAVRELFEKEWKKYKLYNSKLKNQKENTWLMIKNGINLNVDCTITEQKVFFKDAVAYLDIVDSKKHIISDWKTSTRSMHNEKQYILQVKYYAWLYYRKFDIIPKYVDVKYLKYDNEKQINLGCSPTMVDIKNAEKWNEKTREKMNYYINNPDKLPDFNQDYFFSPYKHLFNQSQDVYLKKIKENNIECIENFNVKSIIKENKKKQNNNNNNFDFNITINGSFFYFYSKLLNDFLKGYIDKKFSYEKENAYFIKKNNPYANVKVKFYNQTFNRLPIGFLKQFEKIINDYAKYKKIKINIKIIDKRFFNNKKQVFSKKLLSGKELRDYQKKAVNIYCNNKKNKISIIEVATGGGKTLIATEIIRRLNIKTLFLVEKRELLYQTKDVLEKELGVEVGVIGDGVDEPKEITVATIQTLNRNNEKYKSFLSNIRFLIIDECHHSASDSYIKISKLLRNTEYRLGLTATNKRDDKEDMKITSILGDVCYKIKSKDLIEKKYLILPTITFVDLKYSSQEKNKLESNASEGTVNETKDYNNYYNSYIVNNEKRNDYIKKLIMTHKEKKNLVLVKRVEHGETLKEEIKKMLKEKRINIECDYIHGDMNKKERTKVFETFKQKKQYILIATLSIFSEGIDVPSLQVLINACGNKGEVKSLQSLGRILRINAEKYKAYYFDFYDKLSFFAKASYLRKNYFENEEYKVNIRSV